MGALEGRRGRGKVPSLKASAHSFGLGSGADECGAGDERQTHEERDRGRAAVEETPKSGKRCERHDKVLWFTFSPLREQGVSDLDGA